MTRRSYLNFARKRTHITDITYKTYKNITYKTSPNRGFCALCLVDYIGFPLIVLLLDSRATNLNSCLLDNNSAGFICKYTSVLLLYYLISGKYCLIINYPKNIQMQYLYGKKLITSFSASRLRRVLGQFPHHEFLACKRLLRWITVRLLNALVQAFYISFSSVRDNFNSGTSLRSKRFQSS